MVSQLGDNIIAYFDDPARGLNAGKNDQGVEIEFLLLSLEESDIYDNSINTAANSNGFEGRGPDSKADRMTLVRDGFSFFSGLPSTIPPGQLDFGERRRIVVVDATDPSQMVVRHNDKPLDSGALNSGIISSIRAAVNAATPPPTGLDYATWRAGIAFPIGEGDPNDDPDGDGSDNLLEFYAGSNPIDGGESARGSLTRTPTGFLYVYRRAKGLVGVGHSLEAGALDQFTTFTPQALDVEITDLDAETEELAVTLSSSFGPFLRQSVTLE
jgi:hypothetical protein